MKLRLKHFVKKTPSSVLILPAGDGKIVFRDVGDVSDDLDDTVAHKLLSDYPELLEVYEEKKKKKQKVVEAGETELKYETK